MKEKIEEKAGGVLLNDEKVAEQITELPEVEEKGKEEEEFVAKDRELFLAESASREEIKKRSTDFENGILYSKEVIEEKEGVFLRPRSRCRPFVVFVSTFAGGQSGKIVLENLRKLLHPIQAWDLSEENCVERALTLFKGHSPRIVACGGDGTVNRILEEVDKFSIEPKPPVGVIPIGAANDIARNLGYGGGFQRMDALPLVLHYLDVAGESLVDR